jgi:hypothetical protein
VVRVPGFRSRGSRFDSLLCQIFWEVVDLERGPLSLVSRIEELLGRNSSGSSMESREYSRGDSLLWPRDALYPQKLALTSPTSRGHSVCIVHSRTKAMEFSLVLEAVKPDHIHVTRSKVPCCALINMVFEPQDSQNGRDIFFNRLSKYFCFKIASSPWNYHFVVLLKMVGKVCFLLCHRTVGFRIHELVRWGQHWLY